MGFPQDQVRRGVHAKHYYPKGINQLEEVHLGMYLPWLWMGTVLC